MIPKRGWLVPLGAALVLCAVCFQARAQTSLRDWFNQLKSPGGGICCHNFDGISLDEADWRMSGGKYQVVVQDKWVDVPADTVVTEPNRLGRAHLWLRPDNTVRCFIPGAAG